MSQIIAIVIFVLSVFDVFLNRKLMHVRITVKFSKEDVEESITLKALKIFFKKKLRLSAFQLVVRIFLMSLWVLYSMYARNIAVLCFICAVLYSLMIYFTVMNIKEVKNQMYQPDTTIKILGLDKAIKRNKDNQDIQD